MNELKQMSPDKLHENWRAPVHGQRRIRIGRQYTIQSLGVRVRIVGGNRKKFDLPADQGGLVGPADAWCQTGSASRWAQSNTYIGWAREFDSRHVCGGCFKTGNCAKNSRQPTNNNQVSCFKNMKGLLSYKMG